MNNIWITSDFHFLHDKEFLYKPRGFNSIDEMNNNLIINFNNLVNPEDDVYILGDLMLGGADKLNIGLSFIAQLNGRLHLVRGNHDSDMRWKAYSDLPNVIEQENAIYLKFNQYNFYLSHYPTITSNFDYDKPLKARLLNLCGHSHTLDKWNDLKNGFIYHCELEAHKNKPVLIEEIIKDFQKLTTISI